VTNSLEIISNSFLSISLLCELFIVLNRVFDSKSSLVSLTRILHMMVCGSLETNFIPSSLNLCALQ